MAIITQKINTEKEFFVFILDDRALGAKPVILKRYEFILSLTNQTFIQKN